MDGGSDTDSETGVIDLTEPDGLGVNKFPIMTTSKSESDECGACFHLASHFYCCKGGHKICPPCLKKYMKYTGQKVPGEVTCILYNFCKEGYEFAGKP